MEIWSDTSLQGVAENEELTQFEFDTDMAKCHA